MPFQYRYIQILDIYLKSLDLKPNPTPTHCLKEVRTYQNDFTLPQRLQSEGPRLKLDDCHNSPHASQVYTYTQTLCQAEQ